MNLRVDGIICLVNQLVALYNFTLLVDQNHVAELDETDSLPRFHPWFCRGCSALYKAIIQFFESSSPDKAVAERKLLQQSLLKAIAPLILATTGREFHLLGLDTTPMPRPFAKTLEDRTYIHRGKSASPLGKISSQKN